MNYLLALIRNRRSVINLVSLWLLLSGPAGAVDLQCELAENSQINPAIISSMMEAAGKGYLYRVDTNTSDVNFQVNHFPFSSVEGHFNHFEGGMTLPVDTDQSRQTLFLIKVASVATGDDELDDYIKSAVFFDATQFPDIIFTSTGFEWVSESTARLHGELTLRGTTKPLIFTVHINTAENNSIDKQQKIIMVASAEIQRSEFGMHGMQVFISDTVRFNLKIEATRVGI